MADEERAVRGQILKTYFKFIRKKWGESGHDECISSTNVNPADILDERWYPNEFSLKVQQWIYDSHGPDSCRKMGFTLSTEVGIIAYIAWMAGMKKVLDTAGKQFKANIKHGEVTTEYDGKTAILSLKGINFHKAQCHTTIGVCEGAYKLTKTKGTVEEIECEVEGGEACRYKLVW